MPARTFNRRRLVYLLIFSGVFCVLCGGFYLYRLGRIRHHYQAIRQQGLSAAAAGRASDAVSLLGEYLAREPSDPEVLVAYAASSRKQPMRNNENLARAIWALRHLLRIDPNRIDAQRDLMQLYVETNYHAESLDSANVILTTRIATSSNPLARAELNALGLNAGATDHAMTDAEIEKIRKPLLRLITADPYLLEAIIVRTKSLAQLRQYSQALNSCNWWILSDPDNIDAALIRVELLQDTHQTQADALALADKWITNHPDPEDDALLRGHTYLEYGQFQEGIKFLTQAANANPKSTLAVNQLVADLDAIRKPDLSRAVLVRLLNSDPGNDAVRFDLIGRNWDAGNLSGLVTLCYERQTAAVLPTYILGLRTSALMLLKKTDQARESLKSLSDRADDREAAAWVILIQQALDRRSDLLSILNACAPALEQNPRDYYLRHFLAEACAQLGERDRAIHEWQRVVAENRSWALPAIRLSTLLLEAGRTEQALQAAADAQSRAPHSLDAAFALAQAWTANIEAGHKEDADHCQELVTLLENKYPHDPRSAILKSTLLASVDKPNDAAMVIQKSLNATDVLPEEIWIRLASLSESKHLVSSDGTSLARACLARSQKEHGITPTLAYAKAVATGDPRIGLQLFDADMAAADKMPSNGPSNSATITNTAGGTSSDLVIGWDLARAAYLELIHDPQANTAWQKLADNNASVLRVQRLVLSVQSVQVDQALSARCIDRIATLSGKQDSTWRLARARWLVNFAPFIDDSNHSTPQADEARSLLNDLVTQTPDSVETRLISAMAYERAGRPQDAINETRFATTISPESVSIRLQLARLLEDQGDFEAVQEQLDHLTDADLLATDQRRQAAAIFAQRGQIERAIKLLEEDSRTDKEADTAALLLARLYQRHGDIPKAMAVMQKLLDGKPTSAALNYAAELYASTGQMQQAHAVLDRIGKDTKTAPGIEQIIRAKFMLSYEPVNVDAIIKLFDTATRLAPTNPVMWRALIGADLLFNRPESALSAVNDGLRSIPNDSTLQAISHQPGMLRFAAADPQLQPMLHYFVEDSSAEAASAAAAALNAIYADSLSKPVIDPVTHLPQDTLSPQLQELAAKYPRFAPLQIYLMGRYADRAQYDEAISVANAAGRASPDSASIAQATTALMLTAKHYPEALAAAQQWYEKVPQQRTNAILAKAEALLKLSRSPEAVSLLKPLVDAYSTAGDSAVLQNYSQVTQKYVEAQKAAGIEPDLAALMQPLLSRGARGRVQWMAFAVSNMPTAEAESWLKRASSQLPDLSSPTGVAERIQLSQMYGQLASRSGDQGYAETAEQILKDLVNTNPNINTLMALGMQLDSNGKPAAAIPCYQRAMQIQPNVFAQNNLAMDLARTGHADQAVAYINSALQARPHAAELLDTRAFVYSKSGNFKEALADLHEAIRINPSDASFHLDLAQLLVDNNQSKEAADELKQIDLMSDRLSPRQNQQLKELHTHVAVVSAAPNN